LLQRPIAFFLLATAYSASVIIEDCVVQEEEEGEEGETVWRAGAGRASSSGFY